MITVAKFRSAAIIALLLACAASVDAEKKSRFIWLSDMHFDPTADPTLVDALVKADVGQWPGILASSSQAKVSRFAEDSNWNLLSSSFRAVKATAPEAKFILVTGDSLVHRFREKFENTATQTDEKSFRTFAGKTMLFVAEQIRLIAPGRPVLITLGNNDSECGDYALEPGGAFLKDSSEAVIRLLGPLANETAQEDWTALGSYNVTHPVLKHYRVISVNSVFFSPRYQNACSGAKSDPAREEMNWLSRQLEAANRNGDKVWLFFHIPPGIDGYASWRQSAGSERKTVFMWKPSYTEEFEKLLTQYSKIVTISLAGHEHTDDFRLIGRSLVLLTPGLSPVVRQNPAFRVVSFRKDGSLADAATYYLSNLENIQAGEAPAWKFEYGLAETWRFKILNFASFMRLYDRIETEPDARKQWSYLYSVSHPGGNTMTTENFPSLFCAAGNIRVDEYRKCLARFGTRQ